MFSLKKTVSITAIAVILGGIGGYKLGFLAFRETNAPNRTDEQKIEEGMINLPRGTDESSNGDKNMAQVLQTGSSGENTILVSDQVPGDRVAISRVAFSQAGWVVIHEDRNGKPGSILGAHRFEKGTHSGSVDLLRRTESGRIYYAMLHSDDSDRAFDYKKDLPMQDASGGVLMVKFTAVLAPILQ